MKKTQKKGSIFIEGLVSLSILVCTICGIGILTFKIWSQSFINLESFYLGRARLYNNTKHCKPSTIVPQTLINRNYSCAE
jgi:hypothetical protein